ncbi:MAG: hypothetical protein ACHQT9_04085 [Candidatus Saccharimonadales bacterium]
MLILTLRTDKPESEIGLYDDNKKLTYYAWEAHRTLADTIHIKLKEVLEGQGKDFEDIEGLVVFKGPGSFTGLRIGTAVANTFANGLQIPIIGRKENDWKEKGISDLLSNKNDKIVIPEYGAEPNTTKPKK